jgi:hypothetical protein
MLILPMKSVGILYIIVCAIALIKSQNAIKPRNYVMGMFYADPVQCCVVLL